MSTIARRPWIPAFAGMTVSREDGAMSLPRNARNAAHLAAHGLYDPAEEHDACGVGLVAAIDGKPRARGRAGRRSMR